MPVAITLTSNARALWYLTRGFGLVALVLLTLAMVLGLTQTIRFARPGWPRFVVSGLHKNVSLLALVVLAIHILTAVVDSYAPVHLIDAFVPFISGYRPIWLGLGALAFDLMIAVIVTSLLRDRIGLRTWRAVHWTAYASWPLAIVHGIGTGSDTKLGWVLVLNGTCVTAVLVALWWRLASGWSVSNAARRSVALGASIAVSAAALAWTMSGPLRPGWARRAGTPAALLGSPLSSTTRSSSGAGSGVSTSGAGLTVPFDGDFQGTQQESRATGGDQVSLTIAGRVSGPETAALRIVLIGEPSDAGGVRLANSLVTLGPPAQPDQLQGRVSSLDGLTIVATLTGNHTGSLTATVQLQRADGNALTGTIQVMS